LVNEERAQAGDDAVAANADEVVPVVAVGASAGGLEAMKDLLGAIPAESGACFVIVQHLDPKHKSMLTELLARVTDLPVEVATDGARIRPNRVVVIPENVTLRIDNGRFLLEHPAPPRNIRTPIDTFIRSIAAELGEHAIAIILSGTGSDGMQGVKALKEAGGYAVVQDPGSAAYDSMPRNAIATGLVDQVLLPRDMPAAIVDYLRHVRDGTADGELDGESTRQFLARICQHLKLATGHDFRQYKEPTLMRRVQRRMQVLRIDQVEDYAERLRGDHKECRQLFRELLISVTAFFRDAGAFEALEAAVEEMLARKHRGDAIRVWVPGCATGEEAYSLAILLHDKVDRLDAQPRIQIFATDIDESALAVARRGSYPDSIAGYVPERYLKRYFRQRGSEFQLVEEIRELCIFSTQSLIKDPPFSRLDLLSCRNVLIYLKPELQNRLIPIFHYALRPSGCLLLGPSESITGHEQLFQSIDKKWRLFRRRADSGGAQPRFPLMSLAAEQTVRERAAPSPVRERESVVVVAHQVLLNELGPAYAVVGPNRELIYSGGRMRSYLEMQPGAPSLELLNLAHPSLRMDLRALWHRMATDQQEVVRDHVSLQSDSGHRRLRIVGRPLGEDRSGNSHYLIAFFDLGSHDAVPEARPGDGEGDSEVQALEAELRATKEYLQTTTEELESSNEELKSANEELMSMNEELQSSNEELETSKEELQSVNEELETVNSELANKVDELGRSNADLANFLESTQIATLFLDRSARVRRFTPVARQIFHLIDTDIDRSIADISAKVVDVDLASDVERVLETLVPIEREVTMRDGRAVFMMRLLPSRSPGDVIDGVVATFVDVSRLNEAQERITVLNTRLQAQVEDLSALLQLAPIGIAFADDPECTTITLNNFARRLTGLGSSAAAPGVRDDIYHVERDGRPVANEELPLQKAWRTGRPVEDFQARFTGPHGAFEMRMSAIPVFDAQGRVRRVIGVFSDITPLVQAQAIAEERAKQNAYVAGLGGHSLAGVSAEEMIAEVPRRLAEVLGVEFAKVLLYRPAENDFRLAAQHGFGVPVGTIVPGGLDSQAGYTITVGEPVIVAAADRDPRFQGTALLRDAGVVSGFSVVIGSPGEALGVVGVHSNQPRDFDDDDTRFVQSIANLLAATLRRDAADRQKRLLLDELQHRVKNMLATVQSVASLSLRDTSVPPDVRKRITDRLRALSLAHDLNFRRADERVNLRELVETQCRPFDPDGSRILMDGDETAQLLPSAAIDASMLFHELITNAVKHGALSADAGRVQVSFRLHQDDGVKGVRIDWREIGVTIGSAKKEDGGGMRLIAAIGSQPNFRMEPHLGPDGFRCSITIRE
jgi:two-component system CheB/CheR fusion protein